MKKLWIVALLAFFAFSSWAQESQTRSVGSFTGVKVAEGIDVYLKKGDKESVKIETTGISPDDVSTEVSGTYLKVEMKGGHNGIRHWSAKVYVTYTKLERLSASSAGNIFSETAIKSKSLEVSASSAGSIEVMVDCDEIEASASSAGQVEMRGKTKSLDADVSSGGQVDTYDLEAENVNAEASSGGELKVNVTTSLVAHASSGGSVRYHGSPSKSMTDSSSGGSVKKSN